MNCSGVLAVCIIRLHHTGIDYMVETIIHTRVPPLKEALELVWRGPGRHEYTARVCAFFKHTC